MRTSCGRMAMRVQRKNVWCAAAMKRPLAELVDWLGRENEFPHGAILLTGTGIVPPDDFTLAPADVVTIAVSGVGELTNTVSYP